MLSSLFVLLGHQQRPEDVRLCSRALRRQFMTRSGHRHSLHAGVYTSVETDHNVEQFFERWQKMLGATQCFMSRVVPYRGALNLTEPYGNPGNTELKLNKSGVPRRRFSSFSDSQFSIAIRQGRLAIPKLEIVWFPPEILFCDGFWASHFQTPGEHVLRLPRSAVLRVTSPGNYPSRGAREDIDRQSIPACILFRAL